MLIDLYHKAAEPLPSIPILKEFFEHIDVRKDSLLDFQEFAQIFRNYNPPNLVMGTVPATNDLLCRPENDPEFGKSIRDKTVPEFKNSPRYEEFIRFISRNRKYILERI